MDAIKFDPVHSTCLRDWPTYRVVFSAEETAPGAERPDRERAGDESHWRLVNASTVRDVIAWAQRQAASRRHYVVYVECMHPDEVIGLIRLAVGPAEASSSRGVDLARPVASPSGESGGHGESDGQPGGSGQFDDFEQWDLEDDGYGAH